MKSIKTLIPDIYQLVERRDGWFTEELSKDLGAEIARRLQTQLGEDTNRAPTLRLSQMGPRCPRALWYSIHSPKLAEALPPWATIKYSYGHILEALIITLAKAAGHTVEGEQDAVTLDGITGHRDCVIDGCVLDVKSASTRSFQKFKDGSIKTDDPFGYLEQLDGYVCASADDPIVTVKDRGYDLVIDKTLGHLCLHEHIVRPEHIHVRIKRSKEIINATNPPACECGTQPDGKSGNVKLDTKASYSSYKHCCFPQLRTFLYASGPVYLSQVVRKPDVVEVNKDGQIVYN